MATARGVGFRGALGTISAACALVASGCGTRRGNAVPAARAEEYRSLAARAEKAIAAAGESAGREYANRLRSERYPEILAMLRGETPATEDLPRWAKEVEGCIALIERGATWPKPPVARVPFASSPVEIDGDLSDAAWTGALTFQGLYRFNDTTRLEEPGTTWKLLWDDTCLYFAFDCADTDVVSQKRRRDDHVHFDDCVEMFLLPEARFRTYWELVIGPSLSVYDSIQCKRVDRWGAISDTSQDIVGLKYAVEIEGTLNGPGPDRGYTVEVAVPFAELPGYSRATPKPGDALRFMLVRLDKQGEGLAAYAYQPLQAWGHNIWNHATMELVRRPEAKP